MFSNAEKSFNELKDLCLREQFVNASTKDLALYLIERKPANVTLMADLAEQYQEAHGNLFMTSQKTQGKSL